MYDKELLALVLAVTKWSQYLLGSQFVVRTHQKALKFLLDEKLHIGTQMKWIAKLMQFDFQIEYKKWKENKAADSLSRVPTAHLFMLFFIPVETNIFNRIKSSWEGDEKLKEVIQEITDQGEGKKGFTYYNQQLRRYGKIMVGQDAQIRQDRMLIWHNRTSSGHSGMENTYRRISQLFYWKNLRDDINQYVRSCRVCQRSKYDAAASPGLMQPLAIPTSVWSSISMDFIDGLPKSKGKTTIMVAVDRLTKSSHFIALSHPYTTTIVAQAFLDQVFKLHDMPENIVSDRDPIFISGFWQQLFSSHGATLSTSTAN